MLRWVPAEGHLGRVYFSTSWASLLFDILDESTFRHLGRVYFSYIFIWLVGWGLVEVMTVSPHFELACLIPVACALCSHFCLQTKGVKSQVSPKAGPSIHRLAYRHQRFDENSALSRFRAVRLL